MHTESCQLANSNFICNCSSKSLAAALSKIPHKLLVKNFMAVLCQFITANILN